jgi:hypothetical protein
MVVNNFFVLPAFFRETRTFGIVVIEFPFSYGLDFSGTTIKIDIRVTAGLEVIKVYLERNVKDVTDHG